MRMTSERPGRVFWLTGLAGAGKSTLAKETVQLLRTQGRNAVLLDGDVLRDLFMVGESSFTLEERERLANRYVRLSALLSGQGFDVVCATISLFPEVHNWARANIPEFILIYIRAAFHVLRQRDQRQLYSRAERGDISNVVGVDLPFEEPKNFDMTIENNGDETPQVLAKKIVNGAR